MQFLVLYIVCTNPLLVISCPLNTEDDLRLAALKSAGELLRSAQAMPVTHPLYAQLEKAVAERIRNFANSQAFLPPGQRASRSTGDLSNSTTHVDSAIEWVNGSDNSDTTGSYSTDDWQVIAQEGEMIIYKREVETEDGVVLDPLQVSLPGTVLLLGYLELFSFLVVVSLRYSSS